jgi:hypothetical protein
MQGRKRSLLDNFIVSDHCLLSALTNLIREQGHPINDTDIFCLYNGFDIEYLDYNTGFGIPKLLDNLRKEGATVEEINLSSLSNLQLIQSAKSAKCSVLLYAKTPLLAYNPFYNKQENINRTHFILLDDIDLKHKEVSVIDPHFVTKHNYVVSNGRFSMSIDELEAAVLTSYLINFTQLRSVSKQIIFSKFIENLDKFLHDKYTTENFYGYKGIMKYFTDLETGDINRQKIKTLAYDLHFNISVTTIMYLLKYLKKVLVAYNDDSSEYQSLVNDLKQMSSSWEKIALQVLKSGIKGDLAEFKQTTLDCQHLFVNQKDIMERMLLYSRCLYKERKFDA